MLNYDELYYKNPSDRASFNIKTNVEKKHMRFLGLDLGTGNIASAVISAKDKTKDMRKIKDAFFKMDVSTLTAGMDSSFGENILKQSGANFIKVDGALYVLGDDAFKFANLFHQECLRPMAKGVLNPNSPMSSLMLKELIRGLIGESENEDDILYFCVPANPVDGEFNIIFHTDMAKSLLGSLGYKNINVMNEGLAVIYSECQSEMFAGIGISWGSGMTNICYSHMGIPVFSFSIPKGGDWIDENVAIATNETKASVQSVKESGVDLLNPKNNVESAIAIYYNALIDLVGKKFKEIYSTKPKKELPNIMAPMKVVIAGGTSLAGNFIEKLKPVFLDKSFPVPVSDVVHAKDPLMAVSNGLVTASLISKKK